MAVRVENLSKSFAENKVLDNIDMNVKKGSVHGFLGPNGSGKTTAIRILLGLLTPDNAKIKLLGHDLFLEREIIMSKTGAIVEFPAFFEYLSAWENLLYLTKLSRHNIKPSLIEETLRIVGLEKEKNKKVRKYSYGMKQRLGIAQALLPENQLIFLDEPVNGLDPHGILEIRKLIRKLCENYGITIFLSSHLLSEVEQTCDSVTIINKGKKVCEDTVANLMKKHQRIELITPAPEQFKNFAEKEKLSATPAGNKKNKYKFLIGGSEENIPGLIEKLTKNGIKIFRATKHKKILEDIFVELTNSE
jgi:ABC-2 type transport system ATP-binding protein